MTNKRVVEMAEINDISFEVRRRRWNWLGRILKIKNDTGEKTTALRHWSGHQKGGGRKGDPERPLEEGLREKRETRPDGRAGMWPRRRLATVKNVSALCSTGAVRHDDDDKNV